MGENLRQSIQMETSLLVDVFSLYSLESVCFVLPNGFCLIKPSSRAESWDATLLALLAGWNQLAGFGGLSFPYPIFLGYFVQQVWLWEAKDNPFQPQVFERFQAAAAGSCGLALLRTPDQSYLSQCKPSHTDNL